MRASLLALLLLSLPAAAAPRDFPFTWTSRGSAQGQNSFEAWLTPRLVRTDDYARLDTRLAWVVGVAKNLESQVAVDFDVESTLLSASIDPRFSSLWKWTTWRQGTTFAVGAFGKLTMGFDQFEVEGRLFADWQIDRVLIALNVSGARGLFWNGRDGVDTRLEETLGLRFTVSPTATFGLEGRAKSSWMHREYVGTALYVGPALRFTGAKFWVSIGAAAQVWAQKGDADKDLPEPNELRDNERFVLRLQVGTDT